MRSGDHRLYRLYVHILIRSGRASNFRMSTSGESQNVEEDHGDWLEVKTSSDSDSDFESGSECNDSGGIHTDDQNDFDYDVKDRDVAGVNINFVTKIVNSERHNNIEEADRLLQSSSDTEDLSYVEPGNNTSIHHDDAVQVGHMYVVILGQPKMGKSSLRKTLIHVLSSRSRGWSWSERIYGSGCGVNVDSASSPNVDHCIALQHRNSASCIIFPRHDTEFEFDHENETENTADIGVDMNTNKNKNSLSCCIYALPPHQMSALDEAHLTTLAENGKFDVIIPVICKSETMSMDERQQYTEELKAFFVSQEKLTRLITSEPIAVVCEERRYSWGSVSPLDPEVSQIAKLCDYLEGHLQLKGKVIREENAWLKDEVGMGLSVEQLDKSPMRNKSVPNNSILTLSILLQKRYMMLLSTVLVLLTFQLFAGKTYQYGIIFVSEVGFCASLIAATTKTVRIRDSTKAEMASATVSVCFASILIWHYLFDGADSDTVMIPVKNLQHIDDAKMNITYLESLLSVETSTAQNLSAQLSDAIMKFRACERNVDIMQHRFESVLAHTNLRLEKALELCGSWCDGI